MDSGVINSQRFFILMFLVIVLDIAFSDYFPWVKALYTSDNLEVIALNEKITNQNFSKLLVVKTLRFLSVAFLVVAFYFYHKFLKNIKSNVLFNKDNYRLLFRVSTFLIVYAIIHYILNYFDVERGYFNNGYVVFIAITIYSFGEIFKYATKVKNENDLTI
ncbi:hypothetical protein PW52_04800 [Tamlana sedimentorum]|uniref:DUF2975 domain-containing protein n=1 Tax=Neotamlana sedimentorum TaxID=1435349 RepID=A0A0D7WFF5_9FLAO|nr:DUF2975 domain-containing protein [Tamlana sedimentorum]KJD36477.1 hypothetical protein PW52_04800 [Tamlana sedimentorum]